MKLKNIIIIGVLVILVVLGFGSKICGVVGFDKDIPIISDNPVKTFVDQKVFGGEKADAFKAGEKAAKDKELARKNSNKNVFYVVTVKENKNYVWYKSGFSDDEEAKADFYKCYSLGDKVENDKCSWAHDSWSGVDFSNKVEKVSKKYKESGYEVKPLSLSRTVIAGNKK